MHSLSHSGATLPQRERLGVRVEVGGRARARETNLVPFERVPVVVPFLHLCVRGESEIEIDGERGR
jgi:hypothetical protein